MCNSLLTLTRNFVTKNVFFKTFCKTKLETDLMRNLISCCPCPWASVAKMSSKSDLPFVSYRDDKSDTFFTLTCNFVKKQCFSKNSEKKSGDKNLYENLISCCSCPWASVAKFSSKSDHPLVSYRDDKGGTFFLTNTQFRKNA